MILVNLKSDLCHFLMTKLCTANDCDVQISLLLIMKLLELLFNRKVALVFALNY